MAEYCTASDLYSFGVPRGGIPNPARLVSLVSTSTEVMTLDGHGFDTDDPILFRAEAGGSMPSPLVAGTTYYAIVVSDSTFSVALTAGGSAVNLTTAGSHVLVYTPLPITDCIQWASDVIDEHLVGNSTPLTVPYPKIVVAACADLAASRLLQLTGGATVDLAAKLASTQDLLKSWRKGIALHKSAGQKSGNLAVTGTALLGDTRWSYSGVDKL